MKQVFAYFPKNMSLEESVASKIITRVVSDGRSLRDAVRESVKAAELNKQQLFLVLSILQQYGMVQNGDYKNYWSSGFGEGIGSEGLDSNQGTNFYASNKNKVVTAEDKKIFSLFEQIKTLKEFASDEEIIEINPDLKEVIEAMNHVDKTISSIKDEVVTANVEDLMSIEESFGVSDPNISEVSLSEEKVASFSGRQVEAQEVPADPLVVDEKEGGLEALPEIEEETETPSSDMNIAITPTPEDLTELAKKGPAWEISNMLSINKAEEYYNQLKKQLEEVAFNKNISIDLNGIAKYDKVRNMIDSELSKIKDAIKGKEKIERKEEKLNEEVKGEKPEIEVEETEPIEKAVEPKGIAEAEPTETQEAKNLQ